MNDRRTRIQFAPRRDKDIQAELQKKFLPPIKFNLYYVSPCI